MNRLPAITSMDQVRLGKSIYFDAWLYSMMMDNNIAYKMNPDIIASPEQISFMVALEKDQVYLPCSEDTFLQLLQPEYTPTLRNQYNRAWRIIVRLVRSFEPDRKIRQWVLTCCRFRFLQMIRREHTVLPSRLVKRMTSLAFAQGHQEDPWVEKRRKHTAMSQEFLHSDDIQRALDAPAQTGAGTGIAVLREEMLFVEAARHMFLSIMSRPWLAAAPSALTLQQAFARAVEAAAPLRTLLHSDKTEVKTILFLCDADGGIVFDLALIRCLYLAGHRVILAVKSGFYFYSATIGDIETDPVLKDWLLRAAVVHDPAMSKNELLRLLREFRFVIIPDGTRERLNLYRTSVTFARAWKEADVIIAKGWRNADILFKTSQQFTRDILCYWLDQQGKYHVEAKPHASTVRKFSEKRLMDMADEIITQMRDARRAGKSVMFYSCIIGSIPGQTSTAIQVARTFVNHLRTKLDATFIINPTEHFVDGMDGDDLMFMWERVQRSGYIGVWRFQSVQDIETSFALMERKVPPVWAGKDATFSTGCTKEMRIALDIQAHNHEMQIIGPDPEKFFRRDEYGVGKYFDARIVL